ncbi:MAG TPA: Crp/Fnr family transcriptional regulator [Terriglobales bacterium]|nr:Crp/Fnr family transcriptional regulator [Terriglobales bacterium]
MSSSLSALPVPSRLYRNATIYAHAHPPRKSCHSVRSAAFYASRTPANVSPKQGRGTAADPLFLFHCGLMWHKSGDPSAGWELIAAMRSADRATRALAAEILAGTKDGRLLVRDLRRTRSGLRQTACSGGQNPALPMFTPAEAEAMNTPYGLQMVEDCAGCKLRRAGWYCSLSAELLKSFDAMSHLTTYPGNAILFVEGQTPRGAYVLCSGQVKLSTTSKEGKVLVLKIVQPGEVIGLSAMISGEAYEVTAETIGPCLVNFVEREGLLRLMERNGELGLRSALAVSRDFQSAYRDMHELVLSRSSSGKLARLLLSWISRDAGTVSDVRIHAPVTHEEIAQRIGASRETVTRLLSDLRRRDLIKLEGSTLVIRNRNALEAMAV